MRVLNRTTEPAPALPADAALEEYLHADAGAQRETLVGLVEAAAEQCESETGLALTTATYELELDHWPAGDLLRLPRPPLVSVTSVKYYDAANTLVTWNAANYVVRTSPRAGRQRTRVGAIELAAGRSWPTVYARPAAIKITYSAGYGAADDVPAALRLGMRQLVAHWYRHREATETGTVNELPLGVRNLFERFAVKERV